MNIVNVVVLSTDLIIPIVVLLVGIFTKNHIPKNRNGSVGYRTKRSRSSQEAWEYANKEMAIVMRKLGCILLAATIVICTFFLKSSEVVVCIVCTVVMALQCIALIVGMVGIENKLKEKFDE